MKFLIRPFLVVFILNFGTVATPLFAQLVEICDNGIDDDGDGLIDLNDNDCLCPTIEPISLIPNPSFEDQSCCPANRSQMECADTWIQASAPTTDYIHTCGWLGWEDLPMPLPVPDGDGAVGFRDGRFAQIGESNDNANPNWKEYAGACLTGPLRAGASYKFQFYIGFTDETFSPIIDITFFGTTDCENLPFGNGDNTFGCPTNGPGWQRLGSVRAFGDKEWLQKEINVQPSQDIFAIAIGPACPNRALNINPYYFFDNLILAEQSAFEFDIQASDQLCADNITFALPHYDTLTYQWYKNGMALVGETNAALNNPPGEGTYRVVLGSVEGCVVTKPFIYKIPETITIMQHTICEGESYFFDNQSLTKKGIYRDTFKTINNCDSIIELNLSVNSKLEDSVSVKIFPSESYKIGTVNFSSRGEYRETISSSYGCDSIVNLTLDYYRVFVPNVFSPNGDGINDFFTINGGKDLIQVNNFKVFDRWGNQVFANQELTPNNEKAGWNGQVINQEAATGVYLYTANLLMEDGKERLFSGVVTLVR